MKKLLFVLVSFIYLLSSTVFAAVIATPTNLSISSFENKTAGTLAGDGSVMLTTNSTVSNRFTFKAGYTYQFSITAYGTPASGAYPVMRVGLDGYTLNDVKIESGTAKVYTFNHSLKVGGDRNLQLSFINDASTSTENRNLYIKSISIKYIDTIAPTVAISSGPDSTTTSQTANFVFNYADVGYGVSTVLCSLDNGSFSTCSSPISYSNLTAGSHTFTIKVTDRVGNKTISQPYNWTVSGETAFEGPSSPYALEILQPQPGLNTKNRFYKAYPGLLYNVRLAVAGGAYPYKFSLKNSPSGMTINANTGEINWSNPIESTTAYPATVQVVDKKGTTKEVSWSILVTKDKFMFVDPVNGKNGATGTINDPVKGFIDVYGGNVYESKYSTKNQDYFVYFKGGATYKLEGYTEGKPGVQWTDRQPLVLMAYPGHRPVIDMTTVAFRLVDTTGDNFYFEGFEIANIATDAPSEHRMGLRIGADSSNVTIRKNIFNGLKRYAVDGLNQSAIMISHAGNGKYWSIQDNEFTKLDYGYGILGYSAYKVLVEDNYFHANIDGHQIGPKVATQYWTIRHNTIKNITRGTGIWIYGGDENRGPYGYMDISYNYVQMNSAYDNALSVGQVAENRLIGPVDVYRNTFVGKAVYIELGPYMGAMRNQKNIIINYDANGVECGGCETVNTLVLKDNLTGDINTGIVDSEGKLTLNYLHYLGKAGWQFLNQ